MGMSCRGARLQNVHPVNRRLISWATSSPFSCVASRYVAKVPNPEVNGSYSRLAVAFSRSTRQAQNVQTRALSSPVHGHEGRQRDIKFANDAGRFKGKMGFAF
jgi:hypothetical protein